MIRLLILFVLFMPASAMAYGVVGVEQSSPFEISTLQDVTSEQWFVGELNDFPHTFEFLLTEPTSLRVQVMQQAAADEPTCLSLIAIKEVTRGVEEVMRRSCNEAVWEPFVDSKSNLKFIESQYYEDKLAVGVYRLEVSTPDNQGQYVLKVGTEDNTGGYFATVRSIQALRSELGLSAVGIVFNKYIYVPLFVIVSLGFFGWYYRRKSHQD